MNIDRNGNGKVLERILEELMKYPAKKWFDDQCKQITQQRNMARS